MKDSKTLNSDDFDPRPVSDARVRDEHPREEIEQWRNEAETNHRRWMETLKNRYGKN